jgi:Aspartyl protease
MGGLFSRRGAFGLGTLAVAPWRALASTTPPPDTSDKNIQGVADAAKRLTVEGMINGHGPYTFVVDTGADRSVIAAEVALALGLAPNPEVIVQGIARAVPAPTVIVDKMEFGSIAMNSLVLPVLPRNWLGSDGFLGLDVIDDNRVIFDFRGRKLTIKSSPRSFLIDTVRPETLNPEDVIVRADGSHGRLKAVGCRVDGVRAVAFIDSGSEATIGNYRLAAELQKNGAKFDEKNEVVLTGVTGGSVSGKLMSMSVIRFGPLDFNQSSLIVADMPVFDVWGLADHPALFIGMDFLRLTNAVTIDFGRREYHFKLADIRIASI